MGGERKTAALPPPVPIPPLPDGSGNNLQRSRSMNGRTSGPTRRSTRGHWTKEEDEILSRAVQQYKGKNWKKIAECFKDRTDVQCLHRWQKVLNPELIKGPWTKEEDDRIIQLVDKYGPKKWSTIAQHLPGRIGKQCRERWHNHLNPAINKEAWTQEEELILIHAHQIYGNKWAELTKVLPGRTDNAIKNHWNSSVKKKLDSYIASGLLSQFQDSPQVNQNQSMPSATSRVQQSSGDDSVHRDATEGDGYSESSQGSMSVRSSQIATDMSNAVCHSKEQFLVLEGPGQQEPSSSPASCSERYCTSLEDASISIQEIHAGISRDFTCSSRYFEENFQEDGGISGIADCPFDDDTHELVLMSALNLDAESLSFAENCVGDDPNHEVVSAPMQTSTGNISSALQPTTADVGVDGGHDSSDFTELDGYGDLKYFQSSGFHISETGAISAPLLQSYPRSDMAGPSRCQSWPSVPSEHSFGEGSVYRGLPMQSECEEFFYCDNTTNFQYDDHIDVSDLTEQVDLVKDSSKLVHVNTFCPGPSDTQPTQHSVCQAMPKDEESGALCYEPPRFPSSLDIPFFSCDLAQPCTDLQQEYSPLGIRQLMMSSANSLTPFRLWDSPSVDTPDAVLRSAARTFTHTPSILKKRHRDLLSPLSPFPERRFDKKSGNDGQGSIYTSSLSEGSSRLDLMFNDAGTDAHNNQKSEAEASIENKENFRPEFQAGNTEGRTGVVSDDKKTEEVDILPNAVDTDTEKKKMVTDETPVVLVEHSVNNVPSPCPDGMEDRALESNDEALKSDVGKRDDNSSVSAIPVISSSASPMVEVFANEIGSENLNIFGETPFRRGMESPSAWKSPWYISSSMPGTRFDADLTIEDIGIFMSPGDRGYDAIGLMKQVNQRSAGAYADAREVLGDETPETLMKQKCFKTTYLERENNRVLENQQEGPLLLASDVLNERRMLDFSECGTPEKMEDKGKSACSSSSSCLLKSYR